MSSIQLDSFSAIDSISLINALLNTRSVNTEGRRLPNVLTLEDQDELSRLRDKCRNVERTLSNVPILETPLQRDRREKLIRCWNIDRPPRLMRAARGALFASSYAPRSGIDEPSKDDPITQLCLLSDKLMRFDWHMESWQMESATRHGMHPRALAMITEVQDWYTAVFHRVRMTYDWTTAATSASGRDTIDDLVRTQTIASMIRLEELDDAFFLNLANWTSHAVKADSQAQGRHHTWTTGIALTDQGNSQETSSCLVARTEKVIALVRAGAKENKRLDTILVDRLFCAISSEAHLAASYVISGDALDETYNHRLTAAMRGLRSSWRLCSQEFVRDLQKTAKSLATANKCNSPGSPHLDATTIRATFESLRAYQPCTNAPYSRAQAYQALADATQALTVATRVLLISSRDQGRKGRTEEEDALPDLFASLEQEAGIYAELARPRRPDHMNDDTAEGARLREWYWSGGEPFQLEPEMRRDALECL